MIFCSSVPNQPNVSVDTRTPTSISISWTISSDSVVTGYRVMWERDISLGCPEPIEGSATTISSTTSFTIDELEEDSSYDITVIASNGAGNSEGTVTAMTEEASEKQPLLIYTEYFCTSSSICCS